VGVSWIVTSNNDATQAARGGARHLGCAARELDQKPDRGCLGAEVGLHTRATLPTDRCHLNDAAIRIPRPPKQHRFRGRRHGRANYQRP
jgi:hypothetical protein